MVNKKIDLDTSDERLKQDLARYVEKALELGASRAITVKTDDIPVDDRVPLKCRIPRCFGYGTSAHCPPHALKPAELREALSRYRQALLFTLEVPPEVIVRDRVTIKERIEAYRKVFEIVNRIESMAFFDGHYLAFGFGAGSCRHTFCADKQDCSALSGMRCRHSSKARSSMEAVGIDVYRLVTAQGWEIYPIGSDTEPQDIPKGTLAGIVIVD